MSVGINDFREEIEQAAWWMYSHNIATDTSGATGKSDRIKLYVEYPYDENPVEYVREFDTLLSKLTGHAGVFEVKLASLERIYALEYRLLSGGKWVYNGS